MGKRLLLAIDGLSWVEGGSRAVERALARAPGVERVVVNSDTEMAYVEYDPAAIGPPQLIATVAQAGFRAADANSW